MRHDLRGDDCRGPRLVGGGPVPPEPYDWGEQGPPSSVNPIRYVPGQGFVVFLDEEVRVPRDQERPGHRRCGAGTVPRKVAPRISLLEAPFQAYRP